MGINYRASIGHVNVFGWDPAVADGWPISVVQNSTYDFSQHAVIPAGITPTYTKVSGDPAITIDSVTGMGTIALSATVTTADLVLRISDGRTEVAQVTGLTVTGFSVSQVSLGWDVFAGEMGFKIERSLTGSSDWEQIGTTAAGTLVFIDSTVIANTTYYYRVRAYDAAGDGPYSDTVSATTPVGTTPDTADWLERSTAAGVIWAHDFRGIKELTTSYRPSQNADHGNEFVVGVHPPLLGPGIGTEPDGTTYFEEGLIGAILSGTLPEPDIEPYVYTGTAVGLLRRSSNTTGVLTLPYTDAGGRSTTDLMNAIDPTPGTGSSDTPAFSSFKLVTTAGQVWYLNGTAAQSPINTGTGWQITLFAGTSQAALADRDGFTLYHCRLDDESNPVQTFLIDEDLSTTEGGTRKWPNPVTPPWNPAVGTIPADAYTVVVHYQIDSPSPIRKWKDKICIYATAPAANGKTSVTARRAAISPSGEAGRQENDWVNRGYPCAFPPPEFTTGNVHIGRDNKGGWTRTFSPLYASDDVEATNNGLATDDLAGGAPGDVVTPVKRRRLHNPTTHVKYLNFRAGYYGHADYHGIWTDTNPYHSTGSPVGINTDIENGRSPYDGEAFYLCFDIKYSQTWLYTTTMAKTWFIDNYQREQNSQIVGNAPTMDERRWKWYHNKGNDTNSRLANRLTGTTTESYQYGNEQFQATCITGALTDISACWNPPINQWFSVQIYGKGGHDNEIAYNYGDGATLLGVVPGSRNNTPGAESLQVDCTHQPILGCMTRNLDGTADPVPGLVGLYFASADNPTGADPTTGNYFHNWRLNVENALPGTTFYSYKITTHTRIDATTSRYTLTRLSGTWPLTDPVVGVRVSTGWIDRYQSARYRDTTIRLWKKEITDANWVLICDLQNFPISWRKGATYPASGDANPPGWNEFQPTGYANVDDNNWPPDKTRWIRTTKVILSRNFIAAPRPPVTAEVPYRYNPGHYTSLQRRYDSQAIMTASTIRNAANTVDITKGFLKRWTWRTFEPSLDNYVMAGHELESDLAYCLANGKKLIVMIEDTTYGNAQDTVEENTPNPPYLNSWTAANTVGGYTIARWDSYVVARRKLLHEAFFAYYGSHPALEGIMHEETSLVISAADLATRPVGKLWEPYSAVAYRGAIDEVITHWRSLNSGIRWFFYMNFMAPGPTNDPLAFDGTYLNEIVQLHKPHIVICGPDAQENNTALQTRTFHIYRNNKDTCPVMCHLSTQVYDTGVTGEQMYQFATTDLGANYLCAIPPGGTVNSGIWANQIRPMVQAHPTFNVEDWT